jgi:hypothetical protein
MCPYSWGYSHKPVNPSALTIHMEQSFTRNLLETEAAQALGQADKLLRESALLLYISTLSFA